MDAWCPQVISCKLNIPFGDFDSSIADVYSTCCIGIKDGKIRTLVESFDDDEIKGARVIDAQYVSPGNDWFGGYSPTPNRNAYQYL